MGTLVVLASPWLADGFGLAGAFVLSCEPGPGVETALRGAAADPRSALVLVTDDLWDCVDERVRGDVERLVRPLVMVLPATEGAGPARRRALIADTVRRSIGYRVEPASGGTR